MIRCDESFVRRHNLWRRTRNSYAWQCCLNLMYGKKKGSGIENISWKTLVQLFLWVRLRLTQRFPIYNLGRTSWMLYNHKLYNEWVNLDLLAHTPILSNTTKLILAWFTSLRGVYQIWSKDLCCLFRAKESLIWIKILLPPTINFINPPPQKHGSNAKEIN